MTTTEAAPLELHTIHHNGRDIAYSTSPKSSEPLPPVLFFYPVGAGRRMLLSFRLLFSELFFICVNRPGKGGTSPSDKDITHLDTVIQDVIAVLNHLNMDKVSLVCMCAGTPFGMAFAARHFERTTGQFIGISTWIQPADCGYENTKLLYYIGTQQPHLTGPLTGTLMSSMGYCFSSFPTRWFAGMLRKTLSKEECKVFDEYYTDTNEFCDMLQWMQQDARGGLSEDLKVLLSENMVDYAAVTKSQQSITLWHGTNDNTVPYMGAEWLVEEALPDATLKAIPDGTHEGCMFLLHSSIVDSLKTLRRETGVNSTPE